jgi:hypothetical protein
MPVLRRQLTKAGLEFRYRRYGVLIVQHNRGLVLNEDPLPKYTVYLPDGEFPAGSLRQAEAAILRYMLRREPDEEDSEE